MLTRGGCGISPILIFDMLRWPLPKPTSGRYHLVRFIRSNLVLDIFGERFKMPLEAAYEYAVATIDVEKQRLSVGIDGATIAEFEYGVR